MLNSRPALSHVLCEMLSVSRSIPSISNTTACISVKKSEVILNYSRNSALCHLKGTVNAADVRQGSLRTRRICKRRKYILRRIYRARKRICTTIPCMTGAKRKYHAPAGNSVFFLNLTRKRRKLSLRRIEAEIASRKILHRPFYAGLLQANSC